MLTKSDFMSYNRCLLGFWLNKNQKHLVPAIDTAAQRLFDMGNEVDELARKLYPGGIEIQGYNAGGWENTAKAISNGAKILFQPTAITKDLSARADILTAGDEPGTWDIREVKISTKLSDDHVLDLAFQKICFEDAGIKIGKTYLIHINNKYIRKGEIDLQKLFVFQNITDDVRKKTDEVRELIGKVLAVMEEKNASAVELLESCNDIKNCAFVEHYCKGFPELYKIASKFPPKLLLTLLERETLDYKKIPEDILKSIGYKIKEEFSRIDVKAVRKELAQLEYPLYFFDYETYSSAIPPFDGTFPYQQIPFQYSVHVKDAPGAKIEHLEFLAGKYENPVPGLMAQLKRDIGPRGSVIVWFEKFEKTRNSEMAVMEPEYAQFLRSVNERMFDLYLIFKINKQIYVKSEFRGSASLKVVLPVLCPELSYESLEIREGGTASASWPILTGGKITEQERLRLAKNMLAYCGRDTEAMVGILDKLEKEIK